MEVFPFFGWLKKITSSSHRCMLLFVYLMLDGCLTVHLHVVPERFLSSNVCSFVAVIATFLAANLYMSLIAFMDALLSKCRRSACRLSRALGIVTMPREVHSRFVISFVPSCVDISLSQAEMYVLDSRVTLMLHEE